MVKRCCCTKKPKLLESFLIIVSCTAQERSRPPEHIDATIYDEAYHVFEKTCLTVCCLTLKNGFTVIGESACVSPSNFDAELGRKISRENARNKIWMLEGYLLKESLI